MTAPIRRRSQRQRIQPYLPSDLHKRFAAFCAASGTSESAVAQAALTQYLDRTGDFPLLMRRMDRLGRAVERVQRDLDVVSEALAVWIQLWFAHTPSIPEEAKRAARSESAKRYQQFVDHVASKLAGGHRFVDDLAKETLADDSELTALASAERTEQ